MGILEIKNRTENWKTARTFAPFFADENLRLKLVQRLGEPSTTKADEVKLELFWKGVRDYIDGQNESLPKGTKKLLKGYEDDFAASFEAHFGDLRAAIEEHGRLKTPKPLSYALNDSNAKAKLASNLNGIEIDIVLETPEHLLIGEAKDESNFGRDGSQVLVHQLIGQYVQSTILLDVLRIEKQVMPFIVCDDKAAIKRSGQIQFMLWKGWLEEDRILTWDDIEALR